MPSAAPFISRDKFFELLNEITNLKGEQYKDGATIYGDMSRLVVVWLASTPTERLQSIYEELGWKPPANVRPIHECARLWLLKYHPELLKPDSAQ